jgi:hypothetical protein
MLMLENTRVYFDCDAKWIKDNMPELLKAEKGKFGIRTLNKETFIENQDEQETKSIYEYQNALPREKAGKDYLVEYEYKNAYLICDGIRYKIKKLRIDYDVKEYIDKIHIKGDQIIEAIVKNSLERSEKMIGFDGSVRDRK